MLRAMTNVAIKAFFNNNEVGEVTFIAHMFVRSYC